MLEAAVEKTSQGPFTVVSDLELSVIASDLQQQKHTVDEEMFRRKYTLFIIVFSMQI